MVLFVVFGFTMTLYGNHVSLGKAIVCHLVSTAAIAASYMTSESLLHSIHQSKVSYMVFAARRMLYELFLLWFPQV